VAGSMIFGQVFPLIASLSVRGHWKVARKCVAALVRIIFVTASRRRGQTWLYWCLFLSFYFHPTDLDYSSVVSEVDIAGRIEERIPIYTLRADTITPLSGMYYQ